MKFFLFKLFLGLNLYGVCVYYMNYLLFLSLQINELPKPGYMRQSLEELSIGTYENLVKVMPGNL